MFQKGHRFGHYRIESVLGEGGMGIVYEATDLERGGTIALKVVNPDIIVEPDESGGIEAARRLVREGRAAASLRHPNAIAVFDVGEIDGTPYIAMEIARGRALGQYMGDKRVPIDQRIEWLCAAARGLAAAHTKGIVHRDVKPENVMVCDDGQVKLFDFGVAKPFADPRAPIDATVVTHTGIVVGTPLYMAPEQVLGEKLDPRSDQYAWATVAFELLSGGTHPVSTTQEAHLPVPFAILKGTPRHLREVAPTVPGPVADVVMRALSKDPAKRFVHMDLVVDALDDYLRSAHESADSTAPRESISTPWPHSDPTVARAPQILPRPAAVLDDGDDVRETMTKQFRRDEPPAPAAQLLPTPVVAMPGPESRRRAGGAAVARPLASAPRSADVRADPAVLGPPSFRSETKTPPIGAVASPIAPPSPVTPPVSSLGAGGDMARAPVPGEPLAIRSSLAKAPPRKVDWGRRLLWIPIILVAALAGYASYVLIAVR